MTDADALVESLDWDSRFFGRRIARVRVGSPTIEEMTAVDAWCRAHRIDCLYHLAEPPGWSVNDGYRLVDIRVTLERPTSPGFESAASIRSARDADLAELRTIARSAHRDSRFYQDGRFPRERCDRLYETWIERSVQGWAQAVLVADGDGVLGYVTCHSDTPVEGRIGLVGVAPDAQGRGVGRALVAAAIRWFAERGHERVIVATQGRNVRALRLYERCGFVTRSLQLWYHRWFDAIPSEEK